MSLPEPPGPLSDDFSEAFPDALPGPLPEAFPEAFPDAFPESLPGDLPELEGSSGRTCVTAFRRIWTCTWSAMSILDAMLVYEFGNPTIDAPAEENPVSDFQRRHLRPAFFLLFLLRADE